MTSPDASRAAAAPILIVGAGPTGLVLALSLSRAGVAFRIVDRAGAPGTQSRALIVHARTLEFYAQFGLADRIVAAGTLVETAQLRESGADVTRLSFKEMGRGQSPYPFVLCLPQDEHEHLLADALTANGVRIEWGTRLESLEQGDDEVTATLVAPDARTERATFAYVAGCDGARSRVREQLALDFAGGRYDRLYYVADVRAKEGTGLPFAVALDAGQFALRMPSRKGVNQRLIGFVPQAAEDDPRFDDVRADAERLLGITVDDVHWFSTYRVHHRVAERFRVGRCFLLGDAGHLHSPVGGQGMNTGIGDAINLGWKLADVLRGRAEDALLDTYDVERIAFARTLVATTDRAFRLVSDPGFAGRLLRTVVMPALAPRLTRLPIVRRLLFRAVSQTRIRYPRSALSEGRANGVAGGDRLPWVAALDNHRPLASRDWQVHCIGAPAPAFVAGVAALGLPLFAFDWRKEAASAGFARNGAYLVRPDGYVAWCGRRPRADEIRDYARRHRLRFS